MNTRHAILIGLAAAVFGLVGCGDDESPALDAGTDAACLTGETLCGTECVDLQASASHCGACNNACTSDQACSLGTCVLDCPTGQTNCGGSCVDTDVSRAHCGACDNACASGELCSTGTCSLSCGGDTPDQCGNGCVDHQTDVENCGTCGTTCAVGGVCTAGVCGCPTGQADCSGTCVDLANDRGNCGDCGVMCAVGEVCSSSSCGLSCGGSTPDLCGTACVDTETDPGFCGDCSTQCATFGVCTDGSCGCPTGLTECSGACVDTQSDRNNCGGCDDGGGSNTCANGSLCADGTCVVVYPESCEEFAARSAVPDGNYVLFFEHDPAKPYTAYCHDMATDPKTYLDVPSAPGTNFSSYVAGGGAAGTTVSTVWTRVRFIPSTARLRTNDYTFATSTGSVAHESTTEVPYGVARDCFAPNSQLGTANVDLGSNPFQITSGWGVGGFMAAGTSTANDTDQNISITGGGFCGWNAPRAARNGGDQISLAYLRKSCSDILAAEPSSTDGTYVIDPDAGGRAIGFLARCDMTTDGGGWTLGFIKNSADQQPYPDIGLNATNLGDLDNTPESASTSSTASAAWVDLNNFDYDNLRIAAYFGGSQTYISSDIGKDTLRIDWGEDGYLLYNDSNGYYWCTGAASYMDGGAGQVNRPSGAPADCKNHGSIGSGWDFGGAGTNSGLTLCGSDASNWMYGSFVGNQTFYPTPGAAQALWLR